MKLGEKPISCATEKGKSPIVLDSLTQEGKFLHDSKSSSRFDIEHMSKTLQLGIWQFKYKEQYRGQTVKGTNLPQIKQLQTTWFWII